MHRFGVAGLANGLAVMADKESWTYWDHITGEAFKGPLAGHQLDFWPIYLTTVEAALAAHPDITISISTYRSLRFRLTRFMFRNGIKRKGWLPPGFRRTMSNEIDPRLDKMTQGLGIIVGDKAKYYPTTSIPEIGIDDPWDERTLHIERGKVDNVP